MTAQNHSSALHSCDFWLGLNLQLLWSYQKLRSAEEAASMRIDSTFNNTSCWLIEEGKVTIRSNGSEISVGPGNWVIPPTGEREQIFEGPLKITSVTFLARWRSGHHLYPMRSPHVCPAGDANELTQAANNLIEKVASLSKGESWYLGVHECSQRGWIQIQQAFHSFIDAFAGFSEIRGIPSFQPVAVDSRFLEAKRIIDQLPLSDRLCMEELSSAVGLSRRQLERLFLQEIGLSPSRHFQNRKVEAMQWALGAGKFKFKEAASLLGFNNQANFNRWFVRNFGMKPSEYRKLH